MTGITDSIPSRPACVLVIGSEPGCGKTVFMCGVAGALREHGINTRVLKPLVLAARKNADPEGSFLSIVGLTPQNYPITFMDRPLSIKETNWQNAILMSRSSEQLTFVEMPGGVATPVCYEENNAGTITNNWRDAADMAYEFIQPCIVIVKHQLDAIEQLVLTSTYLRSKGLVVIGCATVEVAPDGGAELERKRNRADFTVGLQNKTSVPFLGCIKFSQSISVPRVSQGNLFSLVKSGIDLNSLTRSLNLAVPTL